MNVLTIDTPIATLLDRCTQAAPLLMELGIDPARHTNDALGDTCKLHGVDPATALEVMLSWEAAELNHEDREWTDAPVADLIDHIVATHHEYLRRQLPRIAILLGKAVHDHGRKQPHLYEILDAFQLLRHLLERHMIVQEVVVFPRIGQLAQAIEHAMPYEGGVQQAIREMRREFQSIGEAFDQLRKMTDHFSAPPGSSTAYQAAVAELANLDRESQRHTHVEDLALFSRALEMDQEMMAR